MRLPILFALMTSIVFTSCQEKEVAQTYFCDEIYDDSLPSLSEQLAPLDSLLQIKTGVYLLEQGEQAMVSRAWLCQQAKEAIDVQYFIFANDNIGMIGTDLLLRAADRGVKVRMLVDDIMVDATPEQLLALASHVNIEIKIYNPTANTGKNILGKLYSVATDFKNFNQRMHNKSFTVDGKVVITGGRNIADEYFDYDHKYNFRDRDILLLGLAVKQVERSFVEFWEHPLSASVSEVVDSSAYEFNAKDHFEFLHQYACNPDNFWPQIRERMKEVPRAFENIQASGELMWVDNVHFVSDAPGKNEDENSLVAGGISTDTLVSLIQRAQRSINIQTPYLITTVESRKLLADAVSRGVEVRILTNSLGSTDALEAFSGYQRDREELLATGAQIFEFKPDAASRLKLMNQDIHRTETNVPTFGLHAKTMVIDEAISVVGTFNFDPRSSNLNTECLTIIHCDSLAEQLGKTLEQDFKSENAWQITPDFNPDSTCTIFRQMKSKIRYLVPKDIL
jgi:putative cardiolipin synthase